MKASFDPGIHKSNALMVTARNRYPMSTRPIAAEVICYDIWKALQMTSFRRAYSSLFVPPTTILVQILQTRQVSILCGLIDDKRIQGAAVLMRVDLASQVASAGCV